MRTEYNLYQDDNGLALNIGEMSNMLTLDMDTGELYGVYLSKRMTPKEMAKIFLKGLTTCSYWMDTDELKALIKEHTANKVIYP